MYRDESSGVMNALRRRVHGGCRRVYRGMSDAKEGMRQ